MKNTHFSKLKLSAAPIVMGVALVSAPAFAQDASGDEAAVSVNEVIVVTGSRITNPNLVQSSPVQVIGRDEASLRQTASAEDLVGELPGVSPGIGSNVNNGSGGFATLNMRGLDTNRNLVLLDGTRLVPSSLQSETDLNILPVALIEQVEIVTGGASSVYGADAVAGVANFILKRDFSGLEASVGTGLTQRGDGARFTANVTAGANFDDGRGNAVLSVGYTQIDPVLQGDRAVSRSALWVSGDVLGSGTAVPTRLNGDQYDPDTGELVPTYSSFNFAPFNYFQTPMERFNIFGAARYEVADDIEVYTKGMFTKSTVSLRLAPSGMFGDTWQFPLNNPFINDSIRNDLCDANGIDAARCSAAGAAADPTDPNYLEVPTIVNRRLVEMGARETDYVTNQFQIWGGVRGSVTDTVKFDVYGTYGQSDRTQTARNWGLKSRLQQTLRAVDTETCVDNSNGCYPVNLFGDGQAIDQRTIDFINAPAITTVTTSLAVVNASLSGEFGNESFLFANTPIGFAVGAEYREYKASQISDAAFGTQDEVMGTGAPSPSFSGGYDVKELFGELIVPIIEDVPGFHSLTLEAGARYSDYSTSGTNWTYKVGGSWEPARGYKVRGIFQHAARSPNISELFLPVTTGLTNLAVDPCQGALPVGNAALTAICIAQGAPAGSIGSIPAPSAGQINATSGGNPALGVEKADSYTIGVVLTPPQVPGFSVTLDYFNIKIADAITTPVPGDILDPCFEDGDAAACALVRRNPLNGSLNGGGDTPGLLLNLTNQGEIKTSGVDARLTYKVPVSFGALSYDFTGTWTKDLKFKASPTTAFRDCVGQYSTNCGFSQGEIMPEWKFNLRTTANIDGFGDVSLLWRWIDGVEYERGLPTAGINPDYLSIDSYSYFDLSLRPHVSDNFQLTFTVQNLLDKDPPVVSSYIGTTTHNSGNTYPATYDVLGRTFFLSANMSF
ncbi:TonB-dependent receptor domain-containing protein [Sphingopyxis sp. MWB1]|uniref:TonB-dependent receptor domain-containing protein n=1 Tax=Sphingopyxis sp. MWB1 TaxID=1537715 RepID=UPI00051A19CD|nr:TonB-dependent receptor [Sphingopyxis sp. MWB1]